jgi:hypothetical protein
MGKIGCCGGKKGQDVVAQLQREGVIMEIPIVMVKRANSVHST